MSLQGQSLTNSQLEILKAFSHQLNEEDLKRLRKTLLDFFAKIVIEEANKVWEKEKWSEQKVQDLLNTKLRKRN